MKEKGYQFQYHKKRPTTNFTSFILAKINNKNIPVLIDTGSQITLGKTELVKNWQNLKIPFKLSGIGKTIYTINKVAINIPIIIGNKQLKIPLLFEFNYKFPLILGKSFFDIHSP